MDNNGQISFMKQYDEVENLLNDTKSIITFKNVPNITLKMILSSVCEGG